jgi:hypothetical protein
MRALPIVENEIQVEVRQELELLRKLAVLRRTSALQAFKAARLAREAVEIPLTAAKAAE